MRNRYYLPFFSISALLLIVYFLFLLVYQPVYNTGMKITLKKDGFRVLKVVPETKAVEAGIEKGMIILSINGTDAPALNALSQSSTEKFLEQSSRLFEEGKTLDLLVLTKEGNEKRLSFTPDPLPLLKRMQVVNTTVINNGVFGIVMVSLGLFFFIRGGGDLSAGKDEIHPTPSGLLLFFLFTTFAGTAVAFSYFHSYWGPVLLVFRFIALDISGVGAGLSLVLFVQVFPKRNSLINWKQPVLLALPLGVKYLFLGALPLTLFGPSSYFIHFYIVLAIVCSIVIIALRYRSMNTGERRKVKWLFTGTGISIFPFLAYLIYIIASPTYIGHGDLSVLNITADAFLLLFPIFVGLGLTWFTLFDINKLLKYLLRVLVYAVFLSVAGFITYMLSKPISPAFANLFFVFLVSLTGPLILPGIKRTIDQTINRSSLLAQKTASSLSRDLLKAHSTEDVYQKVSEALSHMYHPEYVLFLRPSPRGNSIVYKRSFREEEITGQVLGINPLDLLEIREISRRPSGMLIVPLEPNTANLLFIVLGKRMDRDVYFPDDIKQLESLSFQISQALDNTELYERLEESLHEKEHLLQEVHHRVKNNMQIMSSLLNLQAENAGETEVARLLLESGNRIRSMALIHETLYQSEDFKDIEMQDYIQSLAKHLIELYDSEDSIDFILSMNNISLPVGLAVPCGLIINELITNSLKHGKIEGKRSRITASFTLQKEHGILILENTGPPLPKEIDVTNPTTLGLKLVQVLSEQINGSFSYDCGEIQCFTVRFPLNGQLIGEGEQAPLYR